MKVLWSLVVLLAVWWWARGALRRVSREPGPDEGAPPAAANASKSSTSADGPRAMVRCAHCGLHVPADEAVVSAGVPYCGVEHRDAAGSSPLR